MFNNFLKFLFVFTFLQTASAASISVTPVTQSVGVGQKTTVKIVTTEAKKGSCTVSGDTYSKSIVPENGNILLSPTKTVSYTFTCIDNLGKTFSTNAAVTVVVSSSAAGGGQGGAQTGGGQASPQNPNLNNNNVRQATQYSNQTVQGKANELCARYSGSQNVYSVPGVSSGISTVPTSLPTVEEILKSIERYVALSGNEVRQANTLKFCEEYQNMAQASKKLSEQTAKELKNLADNCYADEACLLKKIYEADLEKEIERIKRYPLYGREISEVVLGFQKSRPPTETDYDVELSRECEELWSIGKNPPQCWTALDAGQIITRGVLAAEERLARGQLEIKSQFKDGVMGSRPCVETASGKDPSEVKFYEADCTRYRQEPVLVNQEVLRQITSLPYTQAFSPSSVLGADGVINNIGDRVRNGNLIDPDIASNFGSASGGAGTNPGGTVAGGADLKAAQKNYDTLVSNLDLIVLYFDSGKALYASSTAACRFLPVQTRAATIKSFDTSKKTYTDYRDKLKTTWANALKTPNESHIDLITQINFQLKDKLNQTEILKVRDVVKDLLQKCADAASSARTS